MGKRGRLKIPVDQKRFKSKILIHILSYKIKQKIFQKFRLTVLLEQTYYIGKIVLNL